MKNRTKRILGMTLVGVLAMSSLAGCARNISEKKYATTPVAEYNGQTIMMDEANFMAVMTQYSYEQMYTLYYGQGIDWQSTVSSDGATFETTVKTEVMQGLLQTALLCSKAEEYGVKLSAEDEEKVKTSVSEFLEDADEKLVKESGATEELLTKIYTNNALANRVWEKMVEDVDTTASEEDYRTAKISYLYVSEPDTEEDEEAPDLTPYETYAEQLEKRVKAGEEISTIYDEVKSDETYKVTMNTNVSVAESSYSSTFGEAAYKLATGEVDTCYVEGTGWYILKCDNELDKDATANTIQSEIENRKTTLFNEKYQKLTEAVDAYVVYDRAWDNITFDQTVYVAPTPTPTPVPTEAPSTEATPTETTTEAASEAE